MAVLRHPSRKLTFFDVFLIVLLLFAAVISAYFSFSRDAGTTCTITYGNISETFSLAQNHTIPVTANGHSLLITIENGAVSVSESDCPDQVCVNSKTISRSGQAIVCVPAGLTVRIDGSHTDDADAIAGGVL